MHTDELEKQQNIAPKYILRFSKKILLNPFYSKLMGTSKAMLLQLDQWHLPSFFPDDEAIHGSIYKRPCELALDEWESQESSEVVTIQGNA